MMSKNAHASIQNYVLAACAFFVYLIFPVFAHAEYIESFDVDIDIQSDGSFGVVETIQYVFTEDRHGIYRCIPTIHAEPASSKFKTRYIEVISPTVLMDDVSVPATFTYRNNQFCAQIGDLNEKISGTHTYSISYTVLGAISYHVYGGADLYWNVIGDAWEIPIRGVEVRVTSSSGVLRPERSCYLGTEGKTLSCNVSTREDGVVYYSGRNLNPHDGFTISQALNRNAIAYDVREKYNTLFMGMIGLIGIMFVLMYVAYRHHTKFKQDETIIPQYEPYPNVQPMEAGMLFDGALNHRDISAGFIYLAEQGYLHIRNIHEKVFGIFEVEDFELTLKKMPSQDTHFANEFLRIVFGDTYDVGTTTRFSDIKNDKKKIRQNAEIIENINSVVVESLIQKGLYTGADIGTFFKRPSVIFILGLGVCLVILSKVSLFFFALFVLILFIILSKPRKTKLGYEAVTYLKGFKDFLRVTEAQRYIFHNAPAKNAEQFMKYLPYAIAFGVETEWVNAFKDVTMPNPSWYEDSESLGAFTPLSLTKSIAVFSSGLKSVTNADTSASSSGGGRIGGGSGGGGGGSW